MWTFLFWIFVGVTLLQVLIWVIFPLKWALFARSGEQAINDFPLVSVVICARNEANNLRKYLPLILKQDYPSWELIVVNDNSDDETAEVLTEMARASVLLKVIHLKEKSHPGKKQALTAGVMASKGEWVVTTDADCCPSSDQWLRTLLKSRGPQTEFILGYAPFFSREPSWVNLWFRYEGIYTAMQYLSTAHAGWPFMGVGRNMAWKRDIWQRSSGLDAHWHHTGGDDDLFVNSLAHGGNTAICMDSDAFVFSETQKSWKDWYRRKKRHVGAGTGYKIWHNLVLGGVAFTHSVHYGLGAILLVIDPGKWAWILVFYAVRILLVWMVGILSFRRLKEEGLAIWMPILDALMALWLGGVAPWILLDGDKKQWK